MFVKYSSRFFLSFLFFRNFFFLLLRVLFLEVLSGGVVQNAALVSHHCKFLLANLNCYSYLHLHCRTCPNQKGVGYKSCIICYTGCHVRPFLTLCESFICRTLQIFHFLRLFQFSSWNKLYKSKNLVEICSIELALTSLIGWTNVQYHISISYTIKFIQSELPVDP